MPRLIITKGPDQGKQFDLTESLVGVGRDASNKLRLHDTEVSRRHAEFVASPGGYTLRDLGSANGTFVNNQKIAEHVLQAGENIQIGQTVLVYTGLGDTATRQQQQSDLASQISLITRHDLELSGSIIKSISEAEGSRILAQPEKAKTPWLKTQLANLTILYEASQAISHILDIGELLERILELVFRSIQADRGCVMLRTAEGGDYEPRAARWREKKEGQEKFAVSRTVVDYVLREKEGILVADASQDERFNTGQSIVRFGIREVICVPMKGRHETLGVLYLDTRTTAREVVVRKTASGKFTEDNLTLAIALAHLAALAVEETRYHHAMLQAERLAAMGQTIAALSHSIKNILQGLKSGSELLKMGLGEKNEGLLHTGWNLIEKNQGRIYDLVMDMLSYSKEREPAIEDVNVNELVQEVYELMAGRAKELGVKLEVSRDATLPVVQLDREGIHRAVLNLLGNALDAVEGREDAKVTLATRRDAEPGWMKIIVLDNGTGIAPNKLEDIFKPFVSTKGSRGTGLGLAVSRKVVREHGGDILVTSQVGKGSRFTVRLPIRSPLNIDLGSTSPEIPIYEPPEPN